MSAHSAHLECAGGSVSAQEEPAVSLPVRPLAGRPSMLLLSSDITQRKLLPLGRADAPIVFVGDTDRLLSAKEGSALLQLTALSGVSPSASPARDVAAFVGLARAAQELALRLPIIELRATEGSNDSEVVRRAVAVLEHSNAAAVLDPPSVHALRGVQRAARETYGCLEADRALLWATEELGELVHAVRRGESGARLAEELGQVAVWSFCLANILDVDLGDAVAAAMATEVRRQLAKYGERRPYAS